MDTDYSLSEFSLRVHEMEDGENDSTSALLGQGLAGTLAHIHVGPSLLAESPIRGGALHVTLIRMPEPDDDGSKVFSALAECDEQRVKRSAATLHVHLVCVLTVW